MALATGTASSQLMRTAVPFFELDSFISICDSASSISSTPKALHQHQHHQHPESLVQEQVIVQVQRPEKTRNHEFTKTKVSKYELGEQLEPLAEPQNSSPEDSLANGNIETMMQNFISTLREAFRKVCLFFDIRIYFRWIRVYVLPTIQTFSIYFYTIISNIISSMISAIMLAIHYMTSTTVLVTNFAYNSTCVLIKLSRAIIEYCFSPLVFFFNALANLRDYFMSTRLVDLYLRALSYIALIAASIGALTGVIVGFVITLIQSMIPYSQEKKTDPNKKRSSVSSLASELSRELNSIKSLKFYSNNLQKRSPPKLSIERKNNSILDSTNKNDSKSYSTVTALESGRKILSTSIGSRDDTLSLAKLKLSDNFKRSTPADKCPDTCVTDSSLTSSTNSFSEKHKAYTSDYEEETKPIAEEFPTKILTKISQSEYPTSNRDSPVHSPLYEDEDGYSNFFLENETVLDASPFMIKNSDQQPRSPLGTFALKAEKDYEEEESELYEDAQSNGHIKSEWQAKFGSIAEESD